MKHRNIEYDLAEIPRASGLWRYQIYPKIKLGQKTVSAEFYKTRDEADAACKRAIEREP